MNDPTRHSRADLGSLGSRAEGAEPKAADSAAEKKKKIALAAGLFVLAGGICLYNFVGGRPDKNTEAVMTTLSGADPAGGAAAASSASSGQEGDAPRRESFEVPTGGRPFASQPDPNAPTEDEPEDPPAAPPGGGR